tara:strand:- start:904 stop:1473 length:570 start_codon:yes stop_codon:yes gene_type:complete
MVWKYGTKTLSVGQSWKTDDGLLQPSNWNIWDKDTKAKMGVVWWDDPEPFDARFYLGWKEDGKTLIERKISDEDAKDEDGNLLKDENGNQIVNKGLKSEWVEQTKISANNRLSKTDWYIIRKTEAGTSVPNSIADYRSAVRTASKNIEDKINACSDFAAFKKLFDAPTDKNGKPTGKAPIFDFPNEVTV